MWSSRPLAGVALALIVGTAGAPAASAVPAGTPPPAAPGSIGLRLVDVPRSARDDPRAQLYIIDHLAPGTTVERRIEISNSTTETTHVVLYPGAATISRGSFVGADGNTPNDLSTWTTVGPQAYDVAAHARMTATVTIAIPGDAASGEQYGVVWAETRTVPENGVGVTHVSRVGIRLYVSVGPGGPPAADFTIDTLGTTRSSSGQPAVIARVHNTGGRALDVSGSLRLSAGPGGLRAGPFPATLGTTLAIGDTARVTIPLDRTLPVGSWDARVTLRSGLLERTAHGPVTFFDALPTSSGDGWLIPVLGALLLLIGLAIVIGVRRSRGRLMPRRVAATGHA